MTTRARKGYKGQFRGISTPLPNAQKTPQRKNHPPNFPPLFNEKPVFMRVFDSGPGYQWLVQHSANVAQIRAKSKI